MAELVVEGASLLASREDNTSDQPLTTSQEIPTTTTTTTTTTTSTTRQEPRKNTVSRVLPGGVSVLDRNSPLSSPASSPRTPDTSHNYNIDASGSTYALQVALRNMKERYHKLQKKMALIEDDNSRLITGKSELFGEIGKLQENSIKLREKNLQLNHEIHSKHQECCSLKERFSAMSTENMSLARQLARSAHDNRKLTKKVTSLSEENTRLREKMDQIATQVRALPGGGGGGLACHLSQLTSHRTKIIPDTDDLDSFEDLTTRFHTSLDDDYDQIGKSTDTLASDWCIGDEGEEIEVASSVQTATRRMRRLLSGLQEQHHSLLLLSPLLHTFSLPSQHNTHNDCEPSDGTLGQQDRALSTLTLTPSSGHNTRQDLDVEEEDGTCQSRLATCGSVINSNLTSAGGMIVGALTDDSGGDSNNVNMGGSVLEDRPTSPFDWRQVQMSDDEGREGGSGGSSDMTRPDTRTVSTSPDPSLGGVVGRGGGVAGQEEEDRICPMCNAVFPMIVPQESFESHVVSHFEVENGFEVIS
ncbi:hypothetical protein Pmani_038738 [Petrolisthes manimaculis]|uniref:UBZ1-type domain-containing protein n=1 Tax=Petrolisthes manimaculis TaxID=1843537 RepID=A0AAE1NE30_9EUCA|nr:hypothetical protein Pmani_038738 [Petrolisthes manimaculis]